MQRHFPVLVLSLASLFFVYDIIIDILEGSDSVLHIVVETLIFLSISILFFLELRRLGLLQRELGDERDRTARMSGKLLEAMRKRFAEWHLTHTESEVALLLIKGLTMKEIAEARAVKEKTVRQQATAIYAKSACAGRSELAAYFIEDLLTD